METPGAFDHISMGHRLMSFQDHKRPVSVDSETDLVLVSFRVPSDVISRLMTQRRSSEGCLFLPR